MDADFGGSKGYKGLPMEGVVARRYARLRASGGQLSEWKRQASELTEGVPDGARILDVAPGPGYFAIEVARLGRYDVTGLDISRTFVGIAQLKALESGVHVDFREGDVASMEFADRSFDLIVCQAAFKNFSRPRRALLEMHRVLRDGGTAVIEDLRKDASNSALRDEVSAMRLGRVGSFVTRRILAGLRRRAYTTAQFEQLAAESAFHGGEVRTRGIGMELRLQKRRT
jgi:ubiquinone/menaquinone biosynthesis C-methylase UbiE